MRCVIINNPGPNSKMVVSNHPIPDFNEEQLLIRVKATALNRADLMQRQGKYPPPAGESDIPGLEVAGDVVARGKKVRDFKIGDRIYGLVGSGGYANYCLVHQDLAAAIPKAWDYMTAAAIPEALVTANSTLFLSGQLQAEQKLLIHAAGSGIASMAIQMAILAGASVVTTASTDEKILKARNLGADVVINYKKDDFSSIIPEQSLDLIIDFIGGAYFSKHLQLLKSKGVLIQIASLAGHRAEIDLAQLMRKRLRVEGFVLRSQSLAEKSFLWKSAQERWSDALLNQQLRPIIGAKFNLNNIEEAHQYMIKGAHFGKIVVHVD